MSFAAIRTIATSFTANTRNFDKNVKRSRKNLKDFSGSAFTAKKALIGLGSALAARFTFSGLNQLVKGGDDLQKLSIRLGETTENLQNLHFSARRSGVSVETMNMSLQRMTRRIGEASMGTGDAAKTFKELGLSAEDLLKLPLIEQFRIIGATLGKIEDSGLRVARAAKIFDSEGVRLLQVIGDGKKNLDELNRAFEETAVVVSQASANELARFNDALSDLSTNAKNFAIEGLGSILPVARNVAKELKSIADEVFQLAKLVLRFPLPLQPGERFGDPGKTKDVLFVDKPGRPPLPAAIVDDLRDKPIPAGRPSRLFKDIRRESKETIDISQDLSHVLLDTFENVKGSVDEATESVKNLSRELVKLVARKAILEPLASAIAEGISGSLNPLLQGVNASASQSQFSAQRTIGR